MTTNPTVRLRQRVTGAGARTGPAEFSSPAQNVSPRVTVTHQPIAALRPLDKPLRRRGRGQVDRLAANIARFGCLVPILVTATGEIIDGHAIYAACSQLGHQTVPTIAVDHLSEVEIRTLRISLNKISEESRWDPEALAGEFAHLLAIEPDLIAFTGFSMPEIDFVLAAPGIDGSDPADALPDMPAAAVSRPGDLWEFAGGHRLLCGNARAADSYVALLGGQRAQKVATDPPFG